TDGNVVDAGSAICSDIVEGNASAGFSAHAGGAADFHGGFRGIGGHIIEKNQLRAGVDGPGDLLEGVALDLHGKVWELLADGSKRSGRRTRGQDVVVLNQRAIAYAHAVMCSAIAAPR